MIRHDIFAKMIRECPSEVILEQRPEDCEQENYVHIFIRGTSGGATSTRALSR